MRWEDGTIKTINDTATGAAERTILQPSEGRKYKILYGKITIVTDATVADRTPYCYIKNSAGTVSWLLFYASAVQPASQTVNHQIVPFSGATDLTYAGLVMYTDLIIGATDKITLALTNGVAGDAINYYWKVVELPT